MDTYGRKTIKIGYNEKELLALDDEKIVEFCKKILPNLASTHESNRIETVYLQEYYKGKQDISEKEKHTRQEINNKTTENWAYAIIEFRTAYLLGKPIQYVRNDDNGNSEISKLNQFVRYEGKKAKDQLIYNDILTCGRGFRYVNFDSKNDEDEAPFEIINAEPEHTEVVYSNRLGNEQLFAFIVTPMLESVENPNVPSDIQELNYNEYTFYFRNRSFAISDELLKYAEKFKLEVPEDPYELVKPVTPILINEHIITEYYINKDRISLIEIGKDLFNDINYLESLDKDDMEQFVNAIMVFTNAEIVEEELEKMKELGAISISSTENRQAKVELLQQRLKAGDTQVYYTRLLTALHQILGVPMANDMGTATSGDTGKSKLTGQGFTSAGIRSEVYQTMFEMCDLKALKIILKICKLAKDSGIKNLKVREVELIFERDKSENLLVKTQALLNLYSCDIPRNVANSIIGLFGDPNSVTIEQNRLFGEQVSQQNQTFGNEKDSTTNDNDIANEQDNNITRTEQTAIQNN